MMSFQAMTWAVNQKLPSSEKIVLLMLANRTNDDTGRCDPSHARLADDCGMTDRSVRLQIKKLEERGLIKVVRQTINGLSIRNQYDLSLPEVIYTTKREGSTTPIGGNDVPTARNHVPQRGEPRSGVGGNDVPTKQEVKPISETEKENAPAVASADVIKILSYLNSKTDRFYKADEVNKKFITERLKQGATVDEMIAVVDQKVLDWKGDKVMEKFLRPATLFNKTKFAQYRGEIGPLGASGVLDWRRDPKFAGAK